jgi:hypothetical protein
MKGISIILLGVAVFAGCSTPVKQVGNDVSAILLKEPQTRKLAGAGSVSVPKGIYEPDFEANNGVYYRAPGHLITKGLGSLVTSVVRGGIFIPNPTTEAQKQEIEADRIRVQRAKSEGVRNQTALPATDSLLQGIWMDHQEASGGLVLYGITSPKQIYRVTEAFVYETKKSQP